MIAQTKPPKRARQQDQRFLTMLPLIRHIAVESFRGRDPEAREELTAEVIAHAFFMYVSLVRNGRAELAYATPLAGYGVRRVKSGRRAATAQNVNDASSELAQLQRGFTLERLDRFDPAKDAWRDVLIEDRRSSPADLAATRIDFPAWLDTLPARDRKAAEELASGETTGAVSKMLGVTSGRVSQMRRQLQDSWQAFQGERLDAEPAGATA